MKHLRTLSVYALAAIQLACAQAYSHAPMPHHDAPPPAPNYGVSTVPAPQTQTHAVIGHTVGLSLVDASTLQRLPIYRHRGEYWVAGTPGQRYELWLTSRLDGRRVLATTSVDGINVVTGQTAAELGRGYVLSPHNTSSIKGWRKSEHDVATFNFAAPQASYAAQTGRPANIGVIGVALFPEAAQPILPMPAPLPQPAPMSRADEARGRVLAQKDGLATAPKAGAPALPAPAAKSAAPAETTRSGSDSPNAALRSAAPSVAQGLGTQHGQRVSSYSPTTAFVRESNSPSEVITLRYDSLENLVARGVLQWQATRPHPAPVPTPFPAQSGFVPDPPRLR